MFLTAVSLIIAVLPVKTQDFNRSDRSGSTCLWRQKILILGWFSALSVRCDLYRLRHPIIKSMSQLLVS
jgi:hypothetical protein